MIVAGAILKSVGVVLAVVLLLGVIIGLFFGRR